MAGEKDKQEQEFSLEEILAEYREKKPEEARPHPTRPAEGPVREEQREDPPAQPISPQPSGEETPEQPEGAEEPGAEQPAVSGREKRRRVVPNRVEREPQVPREEPEAPQEPEEESEEPEEEPEKEAPAPRRRKPKGRRVRQAEEDGNGNVIPFPEQSLFDRWAEKLRRKADDYAGHMFEHEGEGEDPETRRLEELVPGVDREDDAPRHERRPRKKEPPPPDTPPGELFRRYSKGLKSLNARSGVVLLLALGQIFLLVLPRLPIAALAPLQGNIMLQIYLSAGLLAAALLLGIDVLAQGLGRLFRLRMGMDTLTALAAFATLADALTMLELAPRDGELPYCAVVTLAIFCHMRGAFQKKAGSRLACRTAAAAKEPYLVTLDEGKWNGRDTFTKWPGRPDGFGSQMQMADGAERIFGVLCPLLLTAALLFAIISSVGVKRPELILWCLSANLTACASFSGLIAFGRPFFRLSRHLAKSGAAIAGWPGAADTRRGSGVVLTDTDFFPPGTVALNGIKVFGDFSVERVIGYTASVIRASGSGLTRIFHDLLRTQGAVYRDVKDLCCYEGGGLSATLRGQQVLVGSASFMTLMEIPLPKGLSVKNAVFCAVEGELAGIFALHYSLHPTVAPALDALLKGGLMPVMATRDFNLIPSMLRQRFKLAADKMEFPPVERRRELSDEESPHSSSLTAILCREGLAPFADAVVGSRRLRTAVRTGAVLAGIGSVVGLLMSFYLTFVTAYASLSPVNLTLFCLLWLVPTLLISGWVDRY